VPEELAGMEGMVEEGEAVVVRVVQVAVVVDQVVQGQHNLHHRCKNV